MLKRLISSIVLIIIFLPIIIFGGRTFLIVSGILACLSLKEILDLKKSHSKIPSGIELLLYASLLVLIFYDYKTSLTFMLNTKILIIITVILLVPTIFYKKEEYETKDAFYLLGIVVFLGISFNNLVILRQHNIFHIWYILLITTSSDTFAYLIGKNFGKHKLLPKVSPKKTVEGAIGGLLMSSILGSLYYYYMMPSSPICFIIIFTCLVSLSAPIGDLIFSKIKRENDIKDYSDLIPGHGGILDRFDSLILAVLVYTLLLNIL